MKPVKPKKMPKALGEWLKDVCEGRCAPQDFEPSDARSILAALEYERQRADKAEQDVSHLRTVAGVLPTLPPADVEAMTEAGRDFQREQTAAVVPPKRKGKAVKHARTDGYDVRREKAKRHG